MAFPICEWCRGEIRDPDCVEFDDEKYHTECFKNDAAEILFQKGYAEWFDIDPNEYHYDPEDYYDPDSRYEAEKEELCIANECCD